MDSQSEKRKRLAQCEKQASLETKGFRQNSQNGLNFSPQLLRYQYITSANWQHRLHFWTSTI